MLFFKKKKTNVENRSNWSAWEGLFPNTNIVGKKLSRNESLTISAVYRCIAVLSDSISTLPAILYKTRPDGGKERATSHFLYTKLKFKPNKRQTAVDFYKQVVVSLTMRGNAYIQKIISTSGEVLELYCLQPDFVRVKELDNGDLEYTYKLAKGGVYKFFTGEILHIKGLSTNGITGLSPIDLAQQTFTLAKSAEEHGAQFFSNGINPSGILMHPNKLSEDTAKKLSERFAKSYSGTSNSNKAIVLEEGMTWTQLSLTNEQAQFIQTRKFELNEVCRWFGVPPHKVGDLERATFSNIEHQSLEFVNDSLRPWIVNIEQAFLTDFFPESQWTKYTFEFLVDAYLRGDTLSRYQAYQIGINNGILNLDEVRIMENRNPLPDSLGKEHYMPLNIATVRKINQLAIEAPPEPKPDIITDAITIDPPDKPDPDVTDGESRAIELAKIKDKEIQELREVSKLLIVDMLNRVNRRAIKLIEERESGKDVSKKIEKLQSDASRELYSIKQTIQFSDNEWRSKLDLFFYEVNRGIKLDEKDLLKIFIGEQ